MGFTLWPASKKRETKRGETSVWSVQKVLDNPRKRKYTLVSFIVKAVKRRVEEERHCRESCMVERDMEDFFEHGLGAAHRPYVNRK